MGLSNRTRMPPPALSAKRIDSPSMMRGSPARSGRWCPAITARGRSDSMVSRAVIESRRDLSQIQAAVLSHGNFDHAGGLAGLAGA
jgi:phosphoribosyl 1,2-cyclic phosphodiesterase